MRFRYPDNRLNVLWPLVLCRFPKTISEWAQPGRKCVDLSIGHIQSAMPEDFGLSLIFGDAFPIGPKLLFRYCFHVGIVTF